MFKTVLFVLKRFLFIFYVIFLEQDIQIGYILINHFLGKIGVFRL